MEYLKSTIHGMLIGIANAIPGVSGGTMAVILNIYDKIMYAISPKGLKENLKFLVPLGIGAVLGVFLLSNVIVAAMENYPMILNFCFIGLVLGSLPAIFKRAKGDGIHNRNWLFFAAALLLMIILTFANPDASAGKSLEDFGGISFIFCVWLFITAAIGCVSMILPGLSGSLILLLLGTYGVIMEAIASFNFLLIGVTGLGVLTGGVVGIKVIKKMLRFHPQALYFGILGLMVGSMIIIWPGFNMSTQGVIAIAGFIGFTLIAYLTSRGSE
ncbi:MAG: DUF368 domain-containing protein [Firmicutes bacterium]|nr:DUF368 domain-containing protein [Bacillota bacterium]MBR6798617.1 DUF368 domain-containing protein [Bacillota bacterium]